MTESISTESRPPRLFISYSHKDKVYFKSFESHLHPLKRAKTLGVWSDQELTPGDSLSECLAAELKKADIVVCLVSADYLASVSCYEKEFVATLKRVNESGTVIIPVIIRACIWKKTGLGQFLAVPEDGQPVASHSDVDAAWLEVIEGIDRRVQILNDQREAARVVDGVECESNELLQLDFQSWLHRNDVPFKHSQKEVVELGDIFVYPDLRRLRWSEEELDTTKSAKELVDVDAHAGRVLLHGEEQSGKTSLAKTLYGKFLAAGVLPLYLSGHRITTADLRKLLQKPIETQYRAMRLEEYCSTAKKRVLLIDDVHAMPLNRRYQGRLLDNVEDLFCSVIMFADSSFMLDEARALSLAAKHWEILPFGHVRRGELIERWKALGQEETIAARELQQQVDESTRHLNSVIRHNVLPPKPIYVLTVLQHLDSMTPGDFSLTSYGYCYQVIIQQALQKVGVRAEHFDKYVNYLGELAYFIFDRRVGALEPGEFAEFQRTYSERFLLSSHDDVVETLHRADILRSDGSRLEFSYRYIFYFYVAKYIAEHLDATLPVVERLCDGMHVELNANVILFLMHHSRDQRVIDDVLLRAAVLFDGVPPCGLSRRETAFIAKMMNAVPALVLECRDVEAERKRELERRDFEGEMIPDGEEGAPEDEVGADVVRSARMVDVIGQMLRNRSGSLLRPQLKELAQAGYESGLKFLSFWLRVTEDDRELLVRVLEDYVKGSGESDPERVAKGVSRMYLALTYGICLAVIRRVANALGARELLEIYEELEVGREDATAIRLINVAIRLEVEKEIPKAKLRKLNEDLERHPVAQRLLKEIVVEHLYMNDVDERDKQWIAGCLGLPMRAQRLISARSARRR